MTKCWCHILLSKFKLNFELKFFAKLNFVMCLRAYYWIIVFKPVSVNSWSKVRRIRGAQTTPKWSFVGSWMGRFIAVRYCPGGAMCGSFPTIIFSGQLIHAVGKLKYLESEREYLIFCTPVNDLIVGRKKMCLYICPLYF